MSIKILDLLKDLLPSGFVNVEPGGKLDKVLDGISDFIESGPLTESGNVSKLRDPAFTTALNELERDHGLINDSNLSEADRRKFLSVFALNKNGNGSRLFLQTRLRNAGFDTVNVISNSPVIDPNIFLDNSFGLYCGDENAYCGDEDAVLSSTEGGNLLVDGINLYDVPSDVRGNFVFFIGGAATGWVLIEDANMELAGIEYWTEDSGTLAHKDHTVHVSGIHSLRVEDNNSEIEQEPYPVLNDPSLIDAYRLYDLDLALGKPFNRDLRNLAFDWDMESEGEDVWESTIGCSILKSETFYQSGTQSLSVSVTTATDDMVYQNILTAGKTYILNIMYKSNDTADIILRNGDTVVDTITPIDTNFNSYEFEFIAVDSNIGFSCGDDSSLFYIDNFICIEKTNEQFLVDNDFESFDGWIGYGSPTYNTYSADHIQGSQCLELLTGNNGLYQSILVPGERYRVKGYCRASFSETSAGNPVIKNGFDTTLFAMQDYNELYGDWYQIDFEFLATDAILYLTVEETGAIPGGYEYGYFDYLTVEKIYDHEIQNIAYVHLIKDGTMEHADTSFWTPMRDAILTKETSDVYNGNRALKVAYDSTGSAYALQNIKVVVGGSYKITGFAKGSTSQGYGITVNGISYWYNGLDWTYFEIDTVVSDSLLNELRLVNYSNSAGEYALFDNVSVTRYDDELFRPIRKDKDNILIDGDCGDPNTTCWDYFNCTIEKHTDSRGIDGLKMISLGSGFCTFGQDCMVVGKKYLLTGHLELENEASPFRILSGFVDLVWDHDITDTGLDYFYIEFTATETFLTFRNWFSSDYAIVYDMYLREIEPSNMPYNIVVDGDMEDSGTDAWTGFNCTLSKDTERFYGTQSLLVNPLSGYITATQDCFVVGRTYSVSGYVRLIEPTDAFSIRNDGVDLWTHDNGVYDFQPFCFNFTATAKDLTFYSDTGDDFLIDQIFAIDVSDKNIYAENDIGKNGRSLQLDMHDSISNIVSTEGETDIFLTTDIYIPSGTVDCAILKMLTTNGSITLDIVDGDLVLNYNDGPFVISETLENIEVGIWHNVVFRFNNSSNIHDLFVDNVLVDTSTYAVTGTPIGTIIKNQHVFYWTDQQPVIVQNFFYYNLAKTDDEIASIYSNFLDVLWGGSVLKEKLSGVENITQTFEINDKVPPSSMHLLPENINLLSWVSSDRNASLFTFIGTIDWRTQSEITVYIVVKGTNGSSVSFSWGDGNIDTADMLGDAISVNIDNEYLSPGYKTITPSGDLLDVDYIKVTDPSISTIFDSFFQFENLSYLDLTGCPIGINNCVCEFNDGIEIILTDCDLVTSEIDKLLIKLYDATIEDLTLYINGVNESRSSLSDTAYAWLIANGATIISAEVGIDSVDSDDIITSTQTNIQLVGANFTATQGSGKVYICDNIVFASAVRIEEQSVDTWINTVIQFDTVIGDLLDDE